MSFSQLPEELVDSIAEHTEDCKHDVSSNCNMPSEPTAFAGYVPRTLPSLCLVSRRTLASARRVLYRRPFALYGYTWKRALSLLFALESNDKHLGRLVRDTSSIDELSENLNIELEDLEISGAEEQCWRWYSRVFKACPNLRKVNFISGSSHELSILFDVLALLPPAIPAIPAIEGTGQVSHPLHSEPKSNIREMTFSDPWGGADYKGEVCLAMLEALALAPIVSLDRLTLYYPNWPTSLGLSDLPPRLPFDIKHIDIVSYQLPLSFYFTFFPRRRTSLQSLHYVGRASLDGEDLLALSNVIGPNLQTLNFRFLSSITTIDVNFLDYSTRTTSPAVPIRAFRAFPRLASLTLDDVHGPSVRLLEILAHNSPLLSQISFLNSRWVADSDRSSNEPDMIFPQNEILAVLRQFKHLESFYPGYLPTLDRQKYEGFATSVKERGIEMKFEICEEQHWV